MPMYANTCTHMMAHVDVWRHELLHSDSHTYTHLSMQHVGMYWCVCVCMCWCVCVYFWEESTEKEGKDARICAGRQLGACLEPLPDHPSVACSTARIAIMPRPVVMLANLACNLWERASNAPGRRPVVQGAWPLVLHQPAKVGGTAARP